MELNAFEALGLSRNDTRVYLSLMEQGNSSAHSIARKLQLPRTTVYSILESLQTRNLVSKQKKRGVSSFRVENPDELLGIIRRRETALEEQRRLAQELVRNLRGLYRGGSSHAPRMEYIEGKVKVERFLDSNLLTWAQSMRALQTTTAGFQDHTFVEMFRPFIKRLWKVIHEDHKIPGRILSNVSSTEKALGGKIPRREVRVLGPEFDFRSSLWVMGDYVILIQTREDPIYASQFNDPLLAANLRLVFSFLYNQARPVVF